VAESVNGATLTLGLVAGLTAAGFVRQAGSGNRRWISDAITRPGKLGGPGYTRRPWSERKQILEDCVVEYGYRSCLGSLQVLLNIGNMGAKATEVIEHDRDWLVDNYGEGALYARRRGAANAR
jgi:hypothetical protein